MILSIHTFALVRWPSNQHGVEVTVCKLRISLTTIKFFCDYLSEFEFTLRIFWLPWYCNWKRLPPEEKNSRPSRFYLSGVLLAPSFHKRNSEFAAVDQIVHCIIARIRTSRQFFSELSIIPNFDVAPWRNLESEKNRCKLILGELFWFLKLKIVIKWILFTMLHLFSSNAILNLIISYGMVARYRSL